MFPFSLVHSRAVTIEIFKEGMKTEVKYVKKLVSIKVRRSQNSNVAFLTRKINALNDEAF